MVLDILLAFHALFLFSESTTQSNFEAMKENMDETVAHVAMKTGLKPWHVVMAIIRKFFKATQRRRKLSFFAYLSGTTWNLLTFLFCTIFLRVSMLSCIL